MAVEDAWVERAVTRIFRLMAAVAVAGTFAVWFWRGWKWGAGFALGGLLSWLNFRWLKQLTEALGGKRLLRGSAVFLGLRYLLLGGVAYVILRYSPISLPAVLMGLFVSIAAVVIEVLFELVYART